MKKLTVFILMVFVLAVGALALPAELNKVTFDGNKLIEDSDNKLNVERGEEYQVKIAFTPTIDLEDVEVEAYISGYEYNNDERISDMIGPFDADEGVTYAKNLKLKIPDDADEDSYKLRIIVSDRHNAPLVANFNLKIALPRHDMAIEDVIINPNNIVEAGNAIIVTVRVDNKGEKDEDDVRVAVTIPELGISNIEYIDEVESGDEESTEEIFLRIPRCTTPGVYDVLVEASFSNKHEKVNAKSSIQVLEDESCEDSKGPKSVVVVSVQTQDGKPGDKLVYPITFTNKGNNAKMFTLSAKEMDWAEISMSPTNTLLVSGEDMQTAYLNIKINENTEPGTYLLNANIATDDKTESITFTANVVKPASSAKGWLEFAVIALVVIVIVLGLIVVFKSREEKEYY